MPSHCASCPNIFELLLILKNLLSFFLNLSSNIQVGIQCTYEDDDGEIVTCIDGSSANSNRPFRVIERTNCPNRYAIPIYAKISYKICNNNAVAFLPDVTENKILLNGSELNPSNGWDDQLQPNSCRDYQINRTFNLCDDNENDYRSMGIEMVGLLSNGLSSSCRCTLTKPSLVFFVQ